MRIFQIVLAMGAAFSFVYCIHVGYHYLAAMNAVTTAWCLIDYAQEA